MDDAYCDRIPRRRFRWHFLPSKAGVRASFADFVRMRSRKGVLMLSAVGFFVSLLLALSYLTVGVLSSPHDGHTFFVRRPPLCRPPYRPCPQHTELTAMDLGGQEGSDEAAAAKISRRSRIIFKVRLAID